MNRTSSVIIRGEQGSIWPYEPGDWGIPSPPPMSETCLNWADYFISVGRKIRQLNRWLQRGTGGNGLPVGEGTDLQFRREVLIDTIKYAVPDGD